MNPTRHLFLTSITAIATVLLSSGLRAQTTSRLSSSFLARGEQAILEVSVPDGQPDEVPEIAPVADMEIEPTGRGPMMRRMPGRRMEFVYEYIVASYEIGKHTIPPIEVISGGVGSFTEPLEVMIFDPDELQWSEIEHGGRIIRYASSFRTLNDRPFENETTPCEIKLYVPDELFIEDWGIPDFVRDGVAAWRFQPSPMRSGINLFGRPHISVAYPSTLTPTRTGKIAIGPAKVRLTTREVIYNPLPQQVNSEIYVEVPKLEIEARPLPDNAPQGFENAVGNFRLEASTTQTELQEGDPITVDLSVTGSGNLDTLRPPQLANTEGWKIYGTTTDQRGDERRQLSGKVVFHQSIRPLEMKPEIPSFRFVFFDPKTESYKSLLTEPITLNMLPGTTPNPAATAAIQSFPVPFERMTDILSILRPAQLTMPSAPTFPAWIGHAAGGLAALALIAKALWMRYASCFKKDPVRDAKIRALREIAKNRSASDTDFLRATGSFIESSLGGNQDPQIQAILAERDAVCFRAEKPTTVLDHKRRDEILGILRKAVSILVFLFALIMSPAARASDIGGQALEAYEAAKYEDAIKLWLGAGNYQNLTADTLYNIGNACYRSGSPGQAALYYRRALVRNSAHAEARQNLRFIERKYGAITVQRPEYQYALARFPLETWKAICLTGLWLCALALLVFPATRPDARLRLAAVAALVLGPMLAATGALGWRYFPNDAEFAPVAKQAVIILEKTALHTDAARTSPEVIDAPPGSLCEIITRSGRWAYVSFATRTRGWIPVESIEKVIPDTAPAPPRFRKPKADGKTA
jgi:tetratricopeptide (TPR) repeat protein